MKRMPSALLFVCLTFSTLAGSALGEEPRPSAEISTDRLRDYISYLASDELGGRDSGEPGLEVAAEYLAARFHEWGLTPAGDDGTFFQYFTVPFGADFGSNAGISIIDSDDNEHLWPGWRAAFPLGYGAKTILPGAAPSEAPLVFAGYGISLQDKAAESGGQGYDDYAGVDVKGKVVIVMRFAPEVKSKTLRDKLLKRAPFVEKLRNAREHGAAGVIFITPPSQTAEIKKHTTDYLTGLVRRAAPRPPTLPAVLARTEAVAGLLAAASERSLEAVEKAIAETGRPQSFALDGFRARLETRRGYHRLRNVAARLPGSGELADETIVIGGHYDHIGRYGGQVNDKNLGRIHNGADDNASGIAVILELARVFAAGNAPRDSGGAPPSGPRRALEFVCFSGEEIGLLGSRHWVQAPRRFKTEAGAHAVFQPPSPAGGASAESNSAAPQDPVPAGHPLPMGTRLQGTGASRAGYVEVSYPLLGGTFWVNADGLEALPGPVAPHRVVTMINLDMVGRAKKDGAVHILGTNSSKAFPPLLEKLAKEVGVPLVGSGRNRFGGGSDHTNFLRNGTPVLFFFTGIHGDYNKPEDDIGRINFDGLHGITRLVQRCAMELAMRAEKPPFNPAAARMAAHGRSKPKLGVLLANAPGGALIEEVLGETVAARGGLKAGDIVRRFGGKAVRSRRDLIRLVGDVQAGDEVVMVVNRGGKDTELRMKFPARRGFGVTFGSVPDYAFSERGVKFEDIRDGSPAAEGGVKAGDVLVSWNGKAVEDVEHWTRMLADHKPGDVVKIQVKRGKETVNLEVKLRAR